MADFKPQDLSQIDKDRFSSYITSVYPHLSVNAGENGAVVLRHLLALVPDVIFFVGLDGYIVYPQATDSASYYLRFA
ncbi:MAG: hypothetical protein ACYDHZ_06230 [Dehalococcoidia bacterium]